MLQQLKKDKSELNYEIKEQKKGFLGLGTSEVTIEVTYALDSKEATYDFLRTYLDDMGFTDAELLLSEENDELRYSISGENLGILIGRHGEMLDSMQYLANLVAGKNDEKHMRVTSRLVANDEYRLWIYLPEGYSVSSASCDYELLDNGIVRLDFTPSSDGTYTLEVEF